MEAWAAGSSDPGAQDRAFLMENATGDGRSYLVRNLVCGGAYYGCFELVDVNAPFQPADFALVDYFGNLLSLTCRTRAGRSPPRSRSGRCATCWTGGRCGRRCWGTRCPRPAGGPTIPTSSRASALRSRPRTPARAARR